MVWAYGAVIGELVHPNQNRGAFNATVSAVSADTLMTAGKAYRNHLSLFATRTLDDLDVRNILLSGNPQFRCCNKRIRKKLFAKFDRKNHLPLGKA